MKLVGSHWQGWEVWLEDSAGRRLNEYQVQHIPEGLTGTRVAKVHVECEDGQEFRICASSRANPDFDWHMLPKVDGRDIEGLAMNSYSSNWPGKLSTYYETLNGRVCERKLTFNKINRVEDGPRLDSEAATQLGTIELLLKGGTNRAGTGLHMPLSSSAALDTVDEKLKKVALSSYIGGGAIVGDVKPISGVYLIQDPKIPVYKILISYATRPVLMLKDIIPSPRAKQERPPAPRIASAKKDKKLKRKSAGGSAEAGPSRIRVETTAAPDEGEIEAVETPSKKRKIHTVDLTNDRKPPVFISLLDDTDDDKDEKPIIML